MIHPKKYLGVLLCILVLLSGCTSTQPSHDKSSKYPMTLTSGSFTHLLFTQNDLISANTNNDFLIFEIIIRNNGNSPVTFQQTDFYIKYQSKKIVASPISVSGDPRFNGSNIYGRTIQPNNILNGAIMFEISNETKIAKSGILYLNLGNDDYSKQVFSTNSIINRIDSPERIGITVNDITITYKLIYKNGKTLASLSSKSYAICNLDIINRCNYEVPFIQNKFTIFDPQGTKYSPSQIKNIDDLLTNQTLLTKDTISGKIIFEIPNTLTDIASIIYEFSLKEKYTKVIDPDIINIIENNAPIAVISSDEIGYVDKEMLFDGSGSSDPDQDPISYIWNLGDPLYDNLDLSFSKTTYYTYSTTGEIEVKLMVMDCGGKANIASRKITILNYFQIELQHVEINYKVIDNYNTIKTPKEGNTFVICTVKITNMADKPEYFSIVNIYLKTKDGNIYSYYYMSGINGGLTSQSISESSSATGKLIFELPQNPILDSMILKDNGQEVSSIPISPSILTTVKNTKPIAMIDIVGDMFIDSNILFSANKSYDPDSDPIKYLLDAGDPKYDYVDTSTSSYFTYSYDHIGLYVVTLKITDIAGANNTISQNIIITHYFTITINGKGIESNPSSYHTGEFYLDIKLTNNAKETKDVNYFSFDIKTTDGTIYSLSGSDGNYPSKLYGGASASWRIYFDLTSDKTPSQLIYDDELTVDI